MRSLTRSLLTTSAAIGVLAAWALPTSTASASRFSGPPLTGYLTAGMTYKLDRFDPATDRMLRPITVGRAPSEMAIAPGGRMAYVATSYSTVWAVNLTAGTARKVTGVGPYPYGVAFSADGRTAYVVTRRALVAIDAATRRVVKRLPLSSPNGEELQTAPHGHLLFMVRVGYEGVTEVSTVTNSIVGKLSVDACGLGVFSPGGQRLYLEGAAGVVAVNTITGAAGPPVPTGGCSTDLLLAPGGKVLYVPGWNSHSRTTMTRIDVTSSGLSAAWTTVVDPKGGRISMALSKDGSTLYVAFWVHKFITPISTATGSAGTPIPDQVDAAQLTTGGSGRYLVAERYNPSTIAVIDTATRKLVRIVRFGNGSIRLAAVPGGSQVVAVVTVWPSGKGWLVPVSMTTGKVGSRIACDGQPDGIYFAR
jgi:DNA-binding beta-propeller fold protein YncE